MKHLLDSGIGRAPDFRQCNFSLVLAGDRPSLSGLEVDKTAMAIAVFPACTSGNP
jgi:hypothetical protein